MSLFLHASCLVSHKKAFVVQIMVKHTHTRGASQDVSAGFVFRSACDDSGKWWHPCLGVGLPFVMLFLGALTRTAVKPLFALALIHIHVSRVSSRGGERFNWALDGEVLEWQVEEEVESRCLRHYWPWAAFPLFDSFCVELESLSSKIIWEIMEYQFAARVGPLTDAQFVVSLCTGYMQILYV